MKQSKTQGLAYSLQLKTLAKYMLAVNIDTNDGFVIVATGQLMQIDHSRINDSVVVTVLWIQFTETSIGVIARSKSRNCPHPDWTSIQKVARVFQCGRSEHALIDRKQFPVVPAEAITIHKSKAFAYAL